MVQRHGFAPAGWEICTSLETLPLSAGTEPDQYTRAPPENWGNGRFPSRAMLLVLPVRKVRKAGKSKQAVW